MNSKSIVERLLVTSALILCVLQPVYSISCYQCNSTDHNDPFQCGEYMTSDIDIKPVSCAAVYNAQYCVKQTGRLEGGLGTRRYCSSLDLGNYCNFIKQPGDDLEYRSCVYTCSSDGCNKVGILKAIDLMIYTLAGFSAFYVLF